MGNPNANAPTITTFSRESPKYAEQWKNNVSQKLLKRKRALIGKTVVGKIIGSNGKTNRYFVKWNAGCYDSVAIGADKVLETFGTDNPLGMLASCTIVGLGPHHKK